MAIPARTIVVAGDVAVERLQFGIPARHVASEDSSPLNWQAIPGTRVVARPGGALHLAQLVTQAAGAPVITHQADRLDRLSPDEQICSFVELGRFPYSCDKKDARNLVYRVARFGGFDGPAAVRPLPVDGDDASADLVVIDDAGNGFRDNEAAWPAALRTTAAHPIVVLKMSRPLAKGRLWDHVRKFHADRLVVVLSADHLRAEGVQLSRRLSWERTAKDFVWQLAANPAVGALANSTHLVVRFGLDGAIYQRRRDGIVESHLYYDPATSEDGFADDCPGEMGGTHAAFTAALVGRIAKEGLDGIGEGTRDGIRCSRRMLREGYGKDADKFDVPAAVLFQPARPGEPRLADVRIPNPTAPEPADPGFWSILREISEARLEDIAFDVVLRGDSASLQGAPVGRFRYLRTVDRAEIESYRSIRNLMLEYLATPNAKRPLSIAVFGAPGSGKSFGVTEVAESVAPGKIEKLELNFSQFGSRADLVAALHQVRDCVLGGSVPLVLLDEFDSAFEGKLGWLKHFLAPMQDGAFRDGEALHPIGRAIFVFAGGTSSTFEEFCGEAPDGSAGRPAPQEFRDAKGPDFVSRLRGYVNILGPNQLGESDHLFLVRRAMLLRSLLERKAQHLFDDSGQARIDPGVLRALIKVPRYHHGVRSMEALLDMSMLAGRTAFEQAALPPVAQLKLHVDAEMFARLVVRDVLLGSARDLLARAIHDKYLRDQASTKPADDPSMQRWEDLSEDLRESNCRQADQLPDKLRRIGYGFAPIMNRQATAVTFTAEEVEILAEIEHERFVVERRLAGWTSGPRDHAAKRSPYLVPWKELLEKHDDACEWDRQAVRGIPELIAKAGFEIYRLR